MLHPQRAPSGECDAEAGAVFGYEAISEERPLFNQDIWRFQDRLPTLQSRYSLTLPSGWSTSSLTFNHERVELSNYLKTFGWHIIYKSTKDKR